MPQAASWSRTGGEELQELRLEAPLHRDLEVTRPSVAELDVAHVRLGDTNRRVQDRVEIGGDDGIADAPVGRPLQAVRSKFEIDPRRPADIIGNSTDSACTPGRFRLSLSPVIAMEARRS